MLETVQGYELARFWRNEVEGDVSDIFLSITGKLTGDTPLCGRLSEAELLREQINRHSSFCILSLHGIER